METNETIVTKTCKICGETEPITSFTLNYEKEDKHSDICKVCSEERKKNRNRVPIIRNRDETLSKYKLSIDFTEILDITFDLYDNDVSGIYNYRIIINEESLGLVEITFDNYSHFNSVKIAISNMIDDYVNLTAIHEQKERIRINKK